MIPKWPILLISVGWSVQGRAQVECPSQGLTLQRIKDAGITPSRNLPFPPIGIRSGGTAWIPVVVHVVWNVPAENVPDATILAMIDQLNLDFSEQNTDLINVRAQFLPVVADAQIGFCLADLDPFGDPTTGITRTMTSETWFDPDSEADAMKSTPAGIEAWDPDHYLNIWICDISSGGGNTAGYAYLPIGGIPGSNIDGIVLDYDLGIGAATRTATHEAGHYLGLQHPWGVDGGCVDDDGFMDTPYTSGPTLSCADSTWQSCGVPVQYENFMDQSACRIMFTDEQAAHMNGVLDGVRNGLITGTLCGGSGMVDQDLIVFTVILDQGAWLISPRRSGPYHVSIIDASGRLLVSVAVTGGPHRVSTDGVARGVYLISVSGSGSRSSRRIILP